MIMFGKKKENIIFQEDQARIFKILLRRLCDQSKRFDVESVWVISKLAHILNCENLILHEFEKNENS